MNIESICPLCQQPILKHGKNKSCECDFEKHEQFLRDIRNEAHRNYFDDNFKDNKKNADRESKTVSKPNLQINRFKNVR